jgi:hypothetical protein
VTPPVGDSLDVSMQGIATNVVCPGALEVSVDGITWIAASGANLDGVPDVFVLLEATADGATMWRVPDPGAWTFADGQPLSEPFEGEI